MPSDVDSSLEGFWIKNGLRGVEGEMHEFDVFLLRCCKISVRDC